MPQIHLGVYMTSGDETVNAVKWALEVETQKVPAPEEGDYADENSRLVIERRGAKTCLPKGWMTDAQ